MMATIVLVGLGIVGGLLTLYGIARGGGPSDTLR